MRLEGKIGKIRANPEIFGNFLKNLCRWNMHSGCSARLFCVKNSKLHSFSPRFLQLVYLPSNATPDLK